MQPRIRLQTMSSAATDRALKVCAFIPLMLVVLYCLIVFMSTLTTVQREFLFLHRLKIPTWKKFHEPEYYGLAPFKTRNFKLETPDGETLGAWHVLPQGVYVEQEPFPPRKRLLDSVFDDAFGHRPTIIYFHGNAATRAQPHRVRGYMEMSGRLNCNVVAVDYRGFADSSGTPSQAGVIIDARTTWDWVAKKVKAAGGDPARNIILCGHSLGTGITSALAERLAAEGTFPRAIILIAPFSSVVDLVDSFYLFGFFPIFHPLKAVPRIKEYIRSSWADPFESKVSLVSTASPMLLLHTLNDGVIPSSHSETIFNVMLERNGTQHRPQVEQTEYEGWGTLKVAYPNGLPLIKWEGKYGGHNDLGWAEGTFDLMAWVADL
ncbi:Monoacylglycerol lipase ABHD12 [Vanrija pseudolonga]|uniref:Monoacylglycerol lipase ABHD12 n=1 Tax=Vanrija pseudolonga TaxID=143232 RepID=A0AAF1BJ20_9TREE|nr:Monoacylglycerol lipase ABHD12 [Vanrija pseudolonga]